MTALIAGSCTVPQNTTTNTANSVQYYVPGTPYFSMGAVGNYDEQNKPEVKVYVKVPYNNLIFKKNNADGTFNASLQLQLALYRIEETRNREEVKTFVRSIRVDNYQQTQSYKQFQFDHLFDVKPGKYELRAVISDQNTQKSTNKTLLINVPAVKENSFIVSDLQLMSVTPDHEGETAEVSYNISPDYDSLKADIQLVLPSSQNNLSVRMNLVKLVSDTLPAPLPYDMTPNRASLTYKGIDYSKADTVQSSLRRLTGISGLIKIDFPMPELEYGNYKVEIIAYGAGGNQLFSRIREFAVKSESYPQITSLQEMAEALKYIMEPEKYEEIMAKENRKELKVAFEAFWLKLYENEPLAKSMINLYYSRVERANEIFPSYKEGWKTDRGMIYIVMGEPAYTEELGDEIIWYYPSNNPQNGGSIYFQFKEVAGSESAPYQHFILQRNIGYHWIYRTAVEDWRRGRIN